MRQKNKSSSKARPKPKPLYKGKTDKKMKFIDDEAEESDDAPTQQHGASDSDDPDRSRQESYEKDFINDGSIQLTPPVSVWGLTMKPIHRDPFDGKGDKSGSSRIPARESKASQVESGSSAMPRRTNKPTSASTSSPAKATPLKRARFWDIVEIESSSEEDLTKMEADDNEFKQPAAVKATALPQSLMTRSVASKLGPGTGAAPDSDSEQAVAADSSVDLPTQIPGFPKMDHTTMKALASLMAHYMANQEASSSSAPAMSNSEAGQGRSHRPRIDHDQVALEAGIQASLHTEATDAKFSPDWDSPYDGKQSPDPSDHEAGPVHETNKSKGKERYVSPLPTTPRPEKSTSSRVKKDGGSLGKRRMTDRDVDPVPVAHPMSKRRKEGALSGAQGIASFLLKQETPAISPDGGSKIESLTMAQYKRSVQTPSGTKNRGSSEERQDRDINTVFMEDLETYKANYDPDAPCQVFDLELQDEALRPHYIGLPPLPSPRFIHPAFVPESELMHGKVHTSDRGGRVRFSSCNSMGAMLFVEAKPRYINPSRVSPTELVSGAQTGSQNRRLLYGDHVAVCVSAICVTSSRLTSAVRIGAKSEFFRKSIGGVFHDQDWERFETTIGLVFNEQIMYGQVNGKAFDFQTKFGRDDAVAGKSTATIPTRMFSTPSPRRGSSSNMPTASSSFKSVMLHTDQIPVYDARTTRINFEKDLDRLGQVLPLFRGEVPLGSFAIVGYSVTAYKAVLGGTAGTGPPVPHVGGNILWVIVCGTPST